MKDNTMQTALPTPPSPEHREASPTFGDMLWEVADLVGGAVITLLPLLLLAVPSVILFLVLPAMVLLAIAAVPVIVAGAILVPTYLLTRSFLRTLGTRRKTHRSSVGRSAPAALRRVGGTAH
jgi:Flp pilus assembly protein TadB